MTTTALPTPERFFDMALSFQRSRALKAAIDLDVFTAVADGADSAAAIAERCHATERGIRILCDYLTICGLVTKNGGRYGLPPDSMAFLSKRSPMYLGGTMDFLASDAVTRNFDNLAETIRRGSVANNMVSEAPDHWVNFAKAMVPMMMPAAMAIADIVPTAGPVRILDIAAGHGIFGIVMAQRNPAAEVVAVDWANVLTVASENAQRMGVADRHRTASGDAFQVDYGAGYDIALLTNFLHHFDAATCTTLLRKVANALKPGGKAVILEFVPNDDRVTPPMAAGFALMMLAGTPAGDAYTLRELRQLLEDAGFRGGVTTHGLPTPETVVIATK
jgi:2-polyprenyl-3-methyl-5-hydroxy-6-metoxy-1,4-benzoquinol methylase